MNSVFQNLSNQEGVSNLWNSLCWFFCGLKILFCKMFAFTLLESKFLSSFETDSKKIQMFWFSKNVPRQYSSFGFSTSIFFILHPSKFYHKSVDYFWGKFGNRAPKEVEKDPSHLWSISEAPNLVSRPLTGHHLNIGGEWKIFKSLVKVVENWSVR